MAGSEAAHIQRWAIVMDKPGVELYHFLLTFRAWQEDDHWVSVCVELDVASQGSSGGDAIEKVIEAALLYLNTIEAVGERRRVFDERDIEVELGLPKPATQRRAVLEHYNETVATRLIGRPAHEEPVTTGR